VYDSTHSPTHTTPAHGLAWSALWHSSLETRSHRSQHHRFSQIIQHNVNERKPTRQVQEQVHTKTHQHHHPFHRGEAKTLEVDRNRPLPVLKALAHLSTGSLLTLAHTRSFAPPPQTITASATFTSLAWCGRALRSCDAAGWERRASQSTHRILKREIPTRAVARRCPSCGARTRVPPQ
jgi:hypothetical protein